MGKRFCKYGHDTEKHGRYTGGTCALCMSEFQARYVREARERERAFYAEMGPAPGLREWRQSLGLSLKELSIECGLISRKSAELGWTPRVPIDLLVELEDGGRAKAETRLHIAQTLWRIEQGMREKEPNEAERLRVAGVA